MPDEDEEPSADEEVDLATGDDDLGVATGDEDEEAKKKRPGGGNFPLADGNASPKGDQRRWADGAVAQLGERRNGIAKVRGSIPLGSTIRTSKALSSAFFVAPDGETPSRRILMNSRRPIA